MRMLYQCPGCWSYVASERLPNGWIECGCGEKMTLIDLRARTSEGRHQDNWLEDES